MKKYLIGITAALATLATVAFAGAVADRSAAITLKRTTGVGAWTNSAANYAAVKIDRIDIISAYYATDTVTVSRITSDLALTNTIATITLTGSAGSYNIVPTTTTGPKFLLYGDIVYFSAGATTGAVAYIDYEVQKH